MEAQEIFDKVAVHLFQQGRQARNPNLPYICCYRGEAGTKCAVGVLIPDELYDGMMEGQTVIGMMSDRQFKLPAWVVDNLHLLNDLQVAHDVRANWDDSATMKERLRQTAEKNHVTADVLDGLAFPWESKEAI